MVRLQTLVIKSLTFLSFFCCSKHSPQEKDVSQQTTDENPVEILLPYLEKAPEIDGDLSDWQHHAFHDGVWDIYRLRYCNWFEPGINRLTDHGDEPVPENDLSARYYMAWDDKYFYMGAKVHDNVNDVSDPDHAPERWYYKDAICWFLEAPRDDNPETFRQGDNAFCFIIDASKPDYGAWWRHGSPDTSYLEEPIPADAVDYVIIMNPWGKSKADFILEARVSMAETFGKSDPNWHSPKVGDLYSVEIVHTDPDGGHYGGHFIIYGTGDDDGTWARMTLEVSCGPIMREKK